MPRETIYKRYIPAVTHNRENNQPAYWFIFNPKDMLVNIKNNNVIPFITNPEELNISTIRTQYLGTIEGKSCYSAEVSPETEPPEGMEFKDLRSLYKYLEEDIFLLAGKAIQIVYWDKNHQFCGRCGAPTTNMKNERAKICPECGFISHTRLSPAVITAIVKDGKLLMARHGYRGDMYGLIAGFVEPGETIEEAVERETMEEVGLKLKNIRYFSSQPWPFPNSLMIGFTAEYESGEIQVDRKEITEAKWFAVDEIPRIPSKMSIASELINWFLENYKIV